MSKSPAGKIHNAHRGLGLLQGRSGLYTWQVWTLYLAGLDLLPGRAGLLAVLDFIPRRAGLYTWKSWTLYLAGLDSIPGRAGLNTWQGWT
jgi:hypothetical protein